MYKISLEHRNYFVSANNKNICFWLHACFNQNGVSVISGMDFFR